MKSIPEADNLRWLASHLDGSDDSTNMRQVSALIYKYAIAGADKIERLHNYVTDYREELADLQEDFKFIKELLPFDADFCGGFCNTTSLIDILTGDNSIAQTIVDYIKWAFMSYGSYIPADSVRCKKIADMYGIETNIQWEV